MSLGVKSIGKMLVSCAALATALALGPIGVGRGDRAGTGPPLAFPDGGAAALLSGAVAPVPSAWAGPAGGKAYTTGTAPLRKDPGGAAVGSVTPGTPVAVVETRGGDAHVSVDGYSSAGSSAVVSALGQRITLVTLSAPDQAQRQTGAETKDGYGTVWTQVTVSGWVPASALTADVQTVWNRGRQIYEAHCSTCHSLYAADQYTANQWPGNLQNMASNGGLAGEDFALVLKYLQTHAKAP